MRRGILGLLLFSVIGCLVSLALPSPKASAATGINPTLSFVGKVVNSNGTNVPDGTYNMEFKIYQDGTNTGSGSTLEWTEDYLVGGTPVTISNGTFQVNLGALTSFGGSVDFNQSVLWLSMQLGNTSSCTITTNFTSNCSGDGEMTPFIRLTASPYAMNADKLDGLDATAFSQLTANQSFTGNNIFTGSTVFQNATNSITAFQVQNSAGSDLINVDTTDTNLVSNPGFEVNTTGWAAANSTSPTRDTSNRYLGFASGTISTVTAAGEGFKQVLNSTLSNGTYTISWYDKLVSGPTFNDVTAAYSATGGAPVNCTNINTQIVSASGWTRHSCQIAVSGANSSNYITIRQIAASSARTWNIDAIQVESGTNASAYGAGALLLNTVITSPTAFRNNEDSTTALQVQKANGTNLLNIDSLNSTASLNGNLTINTTDSGIVRTSYADFAAGTIGSSLVNDTSPSGQLQLSNGTVPNSGLGTVTTSGQPAVDASIGAGASAITRPDGKYLIIKGGSTLTTSVYDSVADTITNSQVLVVGAGTVGVGSVALPRPGGMYTVLMGNGVVNTSNLDPTGTVTSTAGPSLTAAAGAGTVSYKRPDGKFLVTLGAGAGTTNVFDPIANTFAAGPTNSGGVTWGIGSLALPRPDGTALFITGGNTSTTQIYNPSTANPSIGAFPSVGPKLDGTKAAGTCGINNTGSAAIKLANGKYVVLSKASVSALYDPVGNTFTCSNNGPATALGNGAHAIPLQNGKFLIVVGGASTASYIYDPSADTYTAQGTALTAVTAGAFSLMNYDGTWQLFTGTNTCTTGCTNNFNTGLPMNGANTKFISDDISTTALNTNSTLKWTANGQSLFSGTNGATNSAFSGIQFFARTATNGGSCTTSLNAATDIEIQNPGDLLKAQSTDNCVRITAQFNRPLPKKTYDERSTWTGNSTTTQTMTYATPTIYDFSIDNSTVVHKDNFSFSEPGALDYNNGTIPAAPTSNAPTGVGSCTSGTHFWFVTFVTNNVESRMSPASTVQTCSGSNNEPLTAIPLGPSGTTARKIYRTASAALATDTAFLVGTISDNSTVTFTDSLADTSLGAANVAGESSGPSARNVKAVNGQLVLPYGQITPTTVAGTTEYYLGSISGAHPNIDQAQTNDGTFVIARPNKTFVVIAALTTPAANASIYDPASQTFTAQSSTSIPTAANGAGGFALKRPDGNYLVVLGNASATTNIYNPNNNTFSAGPSLSAVAGTGASAIANTDGTYTIVHGAGATTSTIYDPVRNTMTVGPTLPTAANCGFWAIPLQNGRVKVFVGVAAGVAGVTTSLNYNTDTKTFTAGTALASAAGCGSTAFQRQDGWWIVVGGAAGVAGATSTNGNIINPVDGTAGTLALNNAVGAGNTVIPRADGTFLILSGGAQTTSNIYIPYGGATLLAGAAGGSYAAGPAATTAVGTGALSFQRPDGKWVIINGGGGAVRTTMLADTGWVPDGEYISEQIQVPALTANSVLNWKQTSDNYVRMEARTSSSQAGLATTEFNSVGRPGSSIGNSGGETWAQVRVNFQRDFPTFSGVQSGAYNSSGGKVYPYRVISQPTVSSYDINNGNDLLTLQDNGLNVLRITSNGNIYSSSNGGFFSGGADLAENYASSDNALPGELVSIDPAKPQAVKRSSGQYQSNLIGVVSTAPGFVAGSYTATSVPVALAGRVPVKLSTENGPINQGDYLTSSSIPGYAMKATQSGRVIGTALESFDPSKAETCPSEGQGNNPDTKCGTVTMFVNLTDYQGASVEALMAQDQNGGTFGTAAIPNVSFGDINGMVTDKETNVLSFLTALKAKQAAGTAPTGGSSILTNSLNAIQSIVSPVIVADTIRAKTIQADKIEGLEIYTDKISSLSDAVVGLQKNSNGASALGEPSQTSLSQVNFNSLQVAVSLVSLGKIEAKGGLVVDGDSQFNGNTTFAALAQFLGDANFKGNVKADGRVTFNNDTGGIVSIPKGSSRVDVKFSKEYADQPVVSASLYVNPNKLPDGSNEDVKLKEQRLFSSGYSYIISNLTIKGFTIVLSKTASEDIQLSWSALAINNPTTTQGLQDVTY